MGFQHYVTCTFFKTSTDYLLSLKKMETLVRKNKLYIGGFQEMRDDRLKIHSSLRLKFISQ